MTRDSALRLLGLLRRSPVSTGFVLVLWVVGAATGTLLTGPSDNLNEYVAIGAGQLAEGYWWTPLSSAFWCSTLPSYIVVSLLVLAIGVPSERLLGRRMTGLVLVLGQVVGSLLTVGVVALLARTGDYWLVSLSETYDVGPSPALVGLGVVLTYKLSALWRRRLRLFLFTGVLVLALYSGTLLDVMRVVDALLGLALGRVLIGRSTATVGASSRSETKVLVALVVAATAFGPILTLFSKSGYGPLQFMQYMFASPGVGPDEVQNSCNDPALAAQCRLARSQTLGTGFGSAITSIGPALLLLAAAEGLRRGRRFAWWLALVFNLVLAVACALFSLSWAEESAAAGEPTSNELLLLVAPVVVPCLVIGLLLATRRFFTVTAPRATYLRLGLGLVATAVLTAGGYLLIGYWDRAHFEPVPDLGGLLGDLPSRYLPPAYAFLNSVDFLPTGGIALVVWEFCGAVFWVVLLIGLLISFWRSRTAVDDEATARARALMVANSGSSLAYMTTWPGNHYWFTEDGRSALAYRVAATVALTTGGPLGDPAVHSEAVRGFEEFCRRNGWTPCLYSVTERLRDTAVDLGWKAVQVAEDTVVPLAELEFTGKKWQDIRTALNKAGKAGIRAEWVNYPRAPLSITDQVRAISEEWVADKGMPEMGFTLGGMDELNDPDVRCLVAVDEQWTVHGITSWLPVYRDGQVVGWTLDFMRRRGSSTFKGVMEFLIASAAQLVKEEGAEFLSLSGAPLARLDRGEQVTALQRILDVTGKALEPVYGFRSLLSFKAKFQPEYLPLYMAYPDPSALPAIGNAIGRAYLPDLTARQGLRLARKLVRLP
ncbi:DUF2156 domain-containing protein [Kutzneria viridogrisea]|uniref:Phosphatidylglycerol lysyltransferase C-terminal domain-containing protein n=2 Tax=Kutzneria TaxID=43356 RepID=W5WAN9_9PSEU|nr:DUF2156 domain-containing protein [Kutzneria albida]AHH97820.1 hypothetical protein KALB_4458 [Kutzneria albida DSM 43870]MBA8924593.1 lysylphosphatidylglycerol synthetase-like protein (DUF2156 family) [Kutzneria viridogrisea]